MPRPMRAELPCRWQGNGPRFARSHRSVPPLLSTDHIFSPKPFAESPKFVLHAERMRMLHSALLKGAWLPPSLLKPFSPPAWRLLPACEDVCTLTTSSTWRRET